MAPARDGVIGDRARREDREPRGLSPTATAAIIATQCGRLSMRFVPRSADPDEASHTLLNELLAGRACGQGRRRGGTRAICTKSKPLAPPALCSQSRTFHRSSAMFGRVTKLTWLGWVRIISGLWRKKDPNASATRTAGSKKRQDAGPLAYRSGAREPLRRRLSSARFNFSVMLWLAAIALGRCEVAWRGDFGLAVEP